MSMTQEEAINRLEKLISLYEMESTENKMIDYSGMIGALKFSLIALRGPTREIVERMRGEWIPAESDFDDDDTLFDVNDWCDWQCSACYSEICYDDPMERGWLPKFCPACGAPMTDDAVDMMLERWKEAVNYEG